MGGLSSNRSRLKRDPTIRTHTPGTSESKGASRRGRTSVDTPAPAVSTWGTPWGPCSSRWNIAEITACTTKSFIDFPTGLLCPLRRLLGRVEDLRVADIRVLFALRMMRLSCVPVKTRLKPGRARTRGDRGVFARVESEAASRAPSRFECDHRRGRGCHSAGSERHRCELES